jgi:hypothetical protein
MIASTPALRARADRSLDGLELVLEHERVERHVALDPVRMERREHLGEARFVEVRRARPRVELRESEVHRVGACAHRRLERRAITSRREDFGCAASAHRRVDSGSCAPRQAREPRLTRA